MKNMRNHLFSVGASAVLTLSVALAQDQAPQMPAPLPEAVPAEAVGKPVAAPAVVPAAVPGAPRPITPVPTTVLPQPAAARAATAPAAVSGRRSLLTPRKGVATPPPVSGGSMMPPPPAAGLPSASSPSEASASGDAKSKTTTPALKFDNAPSDIILQAYAQETGKTLLMAPDAPKANITLKSQPDIQLTKEEYIDAIEVVLSMHGIVLEPFGEKFVKVFTRKTVRAEGIKILMDSPEGGHPEKSRVVSQMIQLKSITIAEAQKALEGFKKADGLIQTFERTNTLLVTDVQENVNRMLEIVKFIDQPLVAMEEVNVRVIRFAKADDIKKRLEELVSESQKQTQAKEEVKANVAGAPGISRSLAPTLSRPMPTGLSRFGTPQPAVVTPNEILETLVSDADRGMIRGKVQIISDERSNQLIIITRVENMNFFDRIITVLDIETSPDVKVEVMRLEFADAEEVSTMLNDLIGNVSAKKDEKVPASAKGTSTPGAPEQPARSSTLAETLAARASSRAAAAEASSGEPGKSKLGQLSKDNIKILADKRTNALVMMGSLGDLAAIKEIIKGMDIQLSQVLIETVALEVGLKNTMETGLDWVRRVKPVGGTTTITETDPVTGAVSTRTVSTDSNYRSGAGGGGGNSTAQNLYNLASNVTGVVSSGSAGIEYLFTVKDLRLDAIIKAAKTDNDAKVLSSPVLLTVDNKEATIEATELKYLYKGMRYMGYSGGSGTSGGYGGGSYEPDIEQRDVGLTVKVTPRINPSGNVILKVEETFEDVLGEQVINGQAWPTITTRKLSADVSVKNGETVILGGLVKTATSHSESGIPILKDIPYIGKYLFGSTSDSQARSELLVFLTPYVIENQADMDRETRRRKDYINATDVWTKGWSDSKLADPVPASDMKARLARKEAMEKAWAKYRAGLVKQQSADAKIETERIKTEELTAPRKAQDADQVNTLNVTETVEVIKPDNTERAPENKEQAPADGGEPQKPAIEEPKKSWWKIF